MCSRRPRGRRARSTPSKTYWASAWACTTRSSRVQHPCWPASMPRSTYRYLLAAEQHRDADTWGVHLLDAAERGLRPDYTIADAGRGLRAGQEAAWGDTPCHGDVFHIQRQCGGLANTLMWTALGRSMGACSERAARWT